MVRLLDGVVLDMVLTSCGGKLFFDWKWFFPLGCDSIKGGAHKHLSWECRISLPLFGT